MRTEKLIPVALLCSLILLSFTSSRALPEVLRIGLFYGEKVEELDVYVQKGRFRFILDDEAIGVFRGDEGVKVRHEDGEKLRVIEASGAEHSGRELRVEQRSEEGSFKLRKGGRYPVDRLYPGELSVRGKANGIQVINRVRMDEYLAGVVLAEAGGGHHPEFYKVQAVIARTYALHDLQKFDEEGIHLCDKVACQVYRGMNTNEPRIDSAVRATKNIVIVNEDIELITAAFHSNSGGRTAASETAWSEARPYLRSIDDPFSQEGNNYEWERKIPKEEWLNYLEENFDYPVEDEWHLEHATDYCPDGRRVCFISEEDSIPLTRIRRDLGLRSTYFRVRERNDSILFQGKGYGHGVGLSQEGAMRMAELDIPYDEIIHFYYKDVHLVKTNALDFFRDSGGNGRP